MEPFSPAHLLSPRDLVCSAPEFPGHIRNDLPADSLALSGFRSKSFFKKTFKATKAVVLCTHVLCLSESLGDHFWAFGSGVSGEELITATLRDGAGKLTHQGPGETGALRMFPICCPKPSLGSSVASGKPSWKSGPMRGNPYPHFPEDQGRMAC